MARNQKALIQTVKKIPIFTGLSPSQIQSILDITASVRCESGQTIYAANSPSDEMHILLSGELSVVNDEGMTPDRMRVLIVDDEASVCDLVREALTNYEVEEASDGTEAMKAVETDPPDLVITDIRMPHMDGTALLKAVRIIAPNLPIIALSGYVDPEDVEEFDFDGFIKKPFQLDYFRTIVDETMAEAME